MNILFKAMIIIPAAILILSVVLFYALFIIDTFNQGKVFGGIFLIGLGSVIVGFVGLLLTEDVPSDFYDDYYPLPNPPDERD